MSRSPFAFVIAISVISTIAYTDDLPLRVELRRLRDGDARRVAFGRLPDVELAITNLRAETIRIDDAFGPGVRLDVVDPKGERRTFASDPTHRFFAAPLVVVARERATRSLGLEHWLAPTEPGRYVLAVTLVDEAGRSASSNPLMFEVADPPTLDGLELRIATADSQAPWDRRLRLTFHNRSDRPITVIDVQDGSIWGLSPVVYWVIVTDEAGRIVPPLPRCGLVGTRYDDSTVVALSPGAARTQTLRLPFDFTRGRYSIRVHYVLRTRPDAALPKSAESLVVGRVASNEIVVEMPGSPIAEWLRGTPTVAKLAAALAPLDASSADALPIVEAMRRLLEATPLADADRALVRSATVAFLKRAPKTAPCESVEIALDALRRVADPTCATAFEDWTARSYVGSYAQLLAVRGLETIGGREVARAFVRELERNEGDSAVPFAAALAIVTGHEEFNRASPETLDDGARRYEWTPIDVRACKARWLTWWRDEGEAWLRADEQPALPK